MKSRWSASEAQRYLDRYSHIDRDIALRIYSSHLLGQDPTLVLHGGGNTSVKSIYQNILGESVEGLFVKGSGWDLKSIEPAGFPGLDLAYLRRLRALSHLEDRQMMNELRTHLFDASSPDPSVETLLHAFFTEKYIDHSHANAIIALTNHQHYQHYLEECFGADVIIIPYIMPGFALAKLAAERHDQADALSAMVLVKHGLFTYGETAEASYERHIEIVDQAERFLAKQQQLSVFNAKPRSPVDESVFLPLLRGKLALDGQTFILDWRKTDAIMSYVNDPQLLAVSQIGPLTPDHTIRTKPYPMIVDCPTNSAEHYIDAIEQALTQYEADYQHYFQQQNQRVGGDRQPLDPRPRVILVPGLGLIGVGDTQKSAAIAADIYQHTIDVHTKVSQVSDYEALSQQDLFDVEYWSLEQAKLQHKKTAPLAGKVALITGGAGAIGRGIARMLKQAGAEVVITDIVNVAATAKELDVIGIKMDVGDDQSVIEAIEAVVARLGGLDILIANAGIAYSAPIENLDSEKTQALMNINFHGVMRLIREGAKVLKNQSTGGQMILVSSKNVFAPGKEFAAYSASKAAAHQLAKIAALELADFDIRVNMVAPDAVFADGDISSGLWQEVGPKRAAAHAIDVADMPAFYQQRNLLKAKITPDHVAKAVLFFAQASTPTTGASLPVDGGLSETFSR